MRLWWLAPSPIYPENGPLKATVIDLLSAGILMQMLVGGQCGSQVLSVIDSHRAAVSKVTLTRVTGVIDLDAD